MSVFDVRSSKPDDIDTITFAGNNEISYDKCNRLERRSGQGCVAILDQTDNLLYIESKEDALNLIKALNKAIELNWFTK